MSTAPQLAELLPPASPIHVLTFIGERECGKSYFIEYAVRLMVAQGYRAIVHVEQPQARYAGVEVPSLAAARAQLAAPVLVFRGVDFETVCAFVAELRAAEPDRRICLVVDELASQQITTAGHEWATDSLSHLIHVTRGVLCLLGTQSIVDCPRTLRDLSDGGYMLFRTPAIRTEDGRVNGTWTRLANDAVGERRLERLATLPDRLCLHSGRRRPAPFVVSL
jgi:hypothetical protein